MLRLILLLIALAGLDVLATVCIKEAALHRDPGVMLAALLCFMMIGGLLYLAVEIAELTLVTLGWIVIYQVLIIVVDHFRYAVTPPPAQVLAISVAIGALIVAAAVAPPAPAPPAPEPPTTGTCPVTYLFCPLNTPDRAVAPLAQPLPAPRTSQRSTPQ